MIQVRPHPQDALLNPSLFWHSFELREPVTVLTDLIVAAVALYAFFRLYRDQNGWPLFSRQCQWFFLFLALSLFTGGILGHGLQAYLSPAWKKLSWLLGAAGFLFLMMGLIDRLLIQWPRKMTMALKLLLLAKFFGFALYVLHPQSQSFSIVQINSTIDLVGIILPLSLLGIFRYSIQGSGMILLALPFAAGAGFIFSKKIGFGVWFNHLDISHILMAIFVYFIYLGTSTLSHFKSAH